MRLEQGEPAAGPWRCEPVATVVDQLHAAAGGVRGRPVVVAVDGRGAGGKSTRASLLHRAVPASALVHTDDIAWHHSFFDWADLLTDGVLVPVHAGLAVSYRPPGWDSHGRDGSLDVPAGLELVIVEVTAFWREWEEQELPFVASQRTWERACVVVCGTPDTPPPAGHVLVADPPAAQE